VNSNDPKLTAAVSLFTHWDQGFWYTIYVFMLAEGLVLNAFGQAAGLVSGVLLSSSPSFGRFTVGIFGVALSEIWLLISVRQRTYLRGAEVIIRTALSDVYTAQEALQKGLAKFPSGAIASRCLPLMFLLLWVLIVASAIPASLTAESLAFVATLVVLLVPLVVGSGRDLKVWRDQAQTKRQSKSGISQSQGLPPPPPQ